MKYCTKCGAQCEDKAAFCMKCGSKFEIAEQPPPQVILQPPPQPPQPQQYAPQPAYGGYAPPPLAQTPATSLLKRCSSSPLFLIFISLYSLLLVLRLVKVFTDGIAETPSYEMFGYSYGGGTRVDGFSIAFGLIGWILPALTGLGLWLHFMAAAGKKNMGMKTSGLTLIFVCTIINLVLVGIAMLFGFLALVIMLIGVAGVANVDNAAGAALAGVGVALAIYVVIVVLAIIYYAKLLKSISAVSRCAATGNAQPVSSYVAVMNLMLAFFGIIAIIAQIAVYSWITDIMDALMNEIYRQTGGQFGDVINQTIGGLLGVNIWNVAVSALNSAVLIAISAAMLSYNSKIRTLAWEAHYQQPPPNPYGQNRYPSGF